jgi:hypothetical protein
MEINELAQMVMPVTCMWEVLIRNMGWGTVCPDWSGVVLSGSFWYAVLIVVTATCYCHQITVYCIGWATDGAIKYN